MGFDTSVPGMRNVRQPDEGFNFLMSVGMLPGVELNGRLATNDLNCNMYGGPNACAVRGYRDVAASVKFGHVFDLGAGLSASASFGGTDFGGAATFNRAYFAVAGLDWGNWSLHAGGGRRRSASSPLDGGFGGLTWRPSSDLTLYGEAIGRSAWVGAKAFVPAHWTPWPNVRMHFGVHRALTQQNLTAPTTFNAGLTVQLGTLQDARPERRISVHGTAQDAARSALVQARELLAIPSAGAGVLLPSPEAVASPQPVASQSRSVFTAPVRPPSLEKARQAAEALAQAGLEDVHVGSNGAGHVVRFENVVYRWTDLDALGVALATLLPPDPAAPADDRPEPLELQLTKLGVVTARISATPACWRRWLKQSPCDGAEEPVLSVGLREGWWGDSDTTWVVQGHAPSAWRLQGRLAPGLDYRVGSEYGSFDASAGVNLVLQASPWKGAHLDVAHIVPLYNTDDYRPGGYFSEFRILNSTHRMLLHQTVDLGHGLTGRAAAGRLGTKYDGAMGELRWQPGDGRHRLGLLWARFDPSDGSIGKRTSMLSYRYWIMPLQTTVEVHAGQFWNTDRGWALGVRHWFEDVSVITYYRESRFAPEAAFLSPYGSQNVKALGLEFAFPLTPRREWSGDRWRFGFSDRFSLGLETAVRMPDKTNYLIPYHGRFPPVPLGLNGVVYNFDRMSPAYLDANVHLIRRAYRAWLSGDTAFRPRSGAASSLRMSPSPGG